MHAQGLKFGIHIVRGIPRESVAASLPIAGSQLHAQDAADTSDACPWDPTNWGVRDNAAGQAWYDSLIAQYAGWGVDLIKVDCISDHFVAREDTVCGQDRKLTVDSLSEDQAVEGVAVVMRQECSRSDIVQLDWEEGHAKVGDPLERSIYRCSCSNSLERPIFASNSQTLARLTNSSVDGSAMRSSALWLSLAGE